MLLCILPSILLCFLLHFAALILKSTWKQASSLLCCSSARTAALLKIVDTSSRLPSSALAHFHFSIYLARKTLIFCTRLSGFCHLLCAFDCIHLPLHSRLLRTLSTHTIIFPTRSLASLLLLLSQWQWWSSRLLKVRTQFPSLSQQRWQKPHILLLTLHVNILSFDQIHTPLIVRLFLPFRLWSTVRLESSIDLSTPLWLIVIVVCSRQSLSNLRISSIPVCCARFSRWFHHTRRLLLPSHNGGFLGFFKVRTSIPSVSTTMTKATYSFTYLTHSTF